MSFDVRFSQRDEKDRVARPAVQAIESCRIIFKKSSNPRAYFIDDSVDDDSHHRTCVIIGSTRTPTRIPQCATSTIIA